MFNHAVRRRTAVAGVLLTSLALALSTCSTDTVNIPGAAADASSAASNDALISNAPVARNDLIIPGSTMEMLAVYISGKPNVEWVPSAAEAREALLANGTVDVVFSTYTITPKRAEQIDFAGPYFMSGLAVAVKSDNTTVKGMMTSTERM